MATGHWRLTLETILGVGTRGQRWFRWIGSISVFTTGSMPANGVQHNQSIYGWSNKTALGIEHRIWLYTLWPTLSEWHVLYILDAEKPTDNIVRYRFPHLTFPDLGTHSLSWGKWLKNPVKLGDGALDDRTADVTTVFVKTLSVFNGI